MIGAVMYVISTVAYAEAKVSSCFPNTRVMYAEARIYDRKDCKHDNLFEVKKK